MAAPVARLAALRDEAGRSALPFEVSVGGPVQTRDDVARWEEAGVHRLIISPWRRSLDAVEGLRRFAGEMLG